MHPRRPGLQRVGVVGDRGRDGVGGVGPAVVGLGHRDDVVAAGGRHRQPQRQVVGLGAGVDQEHGVQRVGQGGGQPLGERDHDAVVEPRVGVEPAPLPRHRVGQLRMAVAEDRDVVDHVEVAAAVGGEQVLAPAALDARRVVVVVLLHGGERRSRGGAAAPRCRRLAGPPAGRPEQRRPGRRPGSASPPRTPAGRSRAPRRRRAGVDTGSTRRPVGGAQRGSRGDAVPRRTPSPTLSAPRTSTAPAVPVRVTVSAVAASTTSGQGAVSVSAVGRPQVDAGGRRSRVTPGSASPIG